MTGTLIIQKATEELSAKAFGVTEQFLKIHEVVYENGKPKIARVDTEKEDGTAIVYFPVNDEKFYLAIYVDTIPEVSVRHVNTESYNSVYFKAGSEVYSFDELSKMTELNQLVDVTKATKEAEMFCGNEVQYFLNLIQKLTSLKINLKSFLTF